MGNQGELFYFFFNWILDLRVLTESGMEFQIATPILVKDFFIVSIYSFVDNHICIIIFCTDENNEVTTCILTQSICTCLCQQNRMNTCKWLAAETVQMRQTNKHINHWPCVQWIQIQPKKVKKIIENTRSNQVVYI